MKTYKRLVKLGTAYVASVLVLGTLAYKILLPRIQPSDFSKYTLESRILEFNKNKDKHKNKSKLVGNCFSYDLAKGSRINNLAIKGITPREVGEIIRDNCDKDDTIYWAITPNEYYKRDEEAREIVTKPLFRGANIMKRYVSNMFQGKPEIVLPEFQSDEEIRKSLPWSRESLKDKIQPGKLKEVDLSFFRQVSKEYPNLKYVLNPILNLEDVNIGGSELAQDLHKTSDNYQAIFQAIRDSGLPIIDLDGSLQIPTERYLNLIHFGGTKEVRKEFKRIRKEQRHGNKT